MSEKLEGGVPWVSGKHGPGALNNWRAAGLSQAPVPDPLMQERAQGLGETSGFDRWSF